jgi:hypothetical protein
METTSLAIVGGRRLPSKGLTVVPAITLILMTAPASACHRYSYWAFSWPQRCAAVAPPRASMRPALTRVALQTPASVAATSVVPVTAADEPGPRIEDLDRAEIELEKLWLRRAALIYPDLPQ